MTHHAKFLGLFAAVVFLTPRLTADTGEQLYAAQCVRCHGKVGEGTKRYPKPLVGDFSVAQLAEQIQKTMPENDPGSLSKDDSTKISQYVYDGFYSQAAREKNKPVRVELARLTVPQYKNALADILGSFRGGANTRWEDKRGLKAEYFKNRNHGQRLIERLDPGVTFDFGTEAPGGKEFDPKAKEFDAKEFSIRWSGSVLAPETGDYTFIVKSDQSVKLWVNDSRKPVADGYVKSGSDNEYKATLFLLGGRAYPIRLDFSKALQGVKDKMPKPTAASVSLLWQPPHGTVEPIPARVLSPQFAQDVYVDETKFPPDDRSYGWERGTTVSKAWDQATTDAAIDAANYVSTRIEQFANTNLNDPKKKDKLTAFLRQFAKLAFRKPVTEDVERLYVARPVEGTPDLQAAAKRAVLMILKSPRFLYREVAGDPNQYDVAARMAFALWDSVPDQELHALAAQGKLRTAEEIKKHVAERMMTDTRARAKLRGFLHHWLKTDHARDAEKDPKRFPGFDAAIVADLRTSLDLFLDDVVWSEKSDFRQLLLNEETYLNGRLAKYYGASLSENAPFQKVAFEKGRRQGVLTHPFMLATFAYTGETSPIHRGVFLARGILGVGLKPPAEAFTPLAADLHPTLTTRERVELQTKGVNCQSCHAVINPLGFTLENYDAIGRFREQDNKKAVNPEGSYTTRAGEVKTFRGPTELATFLAASEDTHSAFAEQMFHHLVQQSIRAYGPTTGADLREKFAKSGFNVRQLAVEVVSTAAMKGTKN
jgi:cytochrome c553